MWYDEVDYEVILNEKKLVDNIIYDFEMNKVVGFVTDKEFIDLFQEIVGIMDESDAIEDLKEYLLDENQNVDLLDYITDYQTLLLNYNYDLIQNSENPKRRLYYDINRGDEFQALLNEYKDIRVLYDEWFSG